MRKVRQVRSKLIDTSSKRSSKIYNQPHFGHEIWTTRIKTKCRKINKSACVIYCSFNPWFSRTAIIAAWAESMRLFEIHLNCVGSEWLEVRQPASASSHNGLGLVALFLPVRDNNMATLVKPAGSLTGCYTTESNLRTSKWYSIIKFGAFWLCVSVDCARMHIFLFVLPHICCFVGVILCVLYVYIVATTQTDTKKQMRFNIRPDIVASFCSIALFGCNTAGYCAEEVGLSNNSIIIGTVQP